MFAYQAAQNFLSFQGASTQIGSANTNLTKPNLASAIRLSDQYGTEAGVGGDVTWHSGSIDLISGQQDYDLEAFAVKQGVATHDLEIKRVYYESTPAIVKFFDPYAGTGMGMQGLMDSFGFGNSSPAINFMMMPINHDIAKLQAIELNDQVRRSQYSFELINKNLKIFPIPTLDLTKLFVQYIKKSDRNNPYADTGGGDVITNISQVPYSNPVYSTINSIGRQWIFEYALALVKEILGYVRGKYNNAVPIPGETTQLNAPDLLSAASAEKTALIERLRAYFEETSRDKLLERKANEAESLQKELNYVPYTIYVG